MTMFTEELPRLKGRDLERAMDAILVDWLSWKRPAASLSALERRRLFLA